MQTALSTAYKRQTIDERLSDGLNWHWRQDEPFRATFDDLKKSYAGRTTYPKYAKELSDTQKATEKEIENVYLQAIESYVMTMAADRPRALVSTPFQEYQAFANRFQRNLDRYTRIINLEEVFQEVVRDACFLVGVAYVHQGDIATPNVYDATDRFMGRPFVSRIPLSRLVRDNNAKSVQDAAFIGHIYSIPFDEAIRDKRFKKSARMEMRRKGPDSNALDDEDIAGLRGQGPVEDRLFFTSIYVREKHQIRTYWTDNEFNFLHPEPVQVVKCQDSRCPYHFLQLSPVPDEFYPTSPGLNLQLLNDYYAAISRKLEQQVAMSKIVVAAPPNEKEGLEAARVAINGEWILLNSPEAIKPIHIPGPDQNLFGSQINTRQAFSRAADNMDHRLGIGPSADTATQERMIGAMSSRNEAYKQSRFVSWARCVFRSLAHLVYNDTNLFIRGSYSVGDVEVEDHWYPNNSADARMGDYEREYMVDIDPYSMGYKSPADKAMFINQQVMQYLPILPALAQLGVQLDLAGHLDTMAKFNDVPELRNSFKFAQAPQVIEAPSGGGGAGGAKGEYIHRSAPSRKNPEQELMGMFAQQPQEGAA